MHRPQRGVAQSLIGAPLALGLGTAGALAALVIAATVPMAAQGTGERRDCNRPANEPISHVVLPGEPVFVLPSRDGCWLFVRTLDALSVLRRDQGRMEPVGAPLPLAGGGGMVLTHDDTMLVARLPGQLAFFDTGRLIAGAPDPGHGVIESSRFMRPAVILPGTLLVTPDDRYLIATQHSTAWLTVVDLDRVRVEGPTLDAVVHGVPTGEFPASTWLSPDGSSLYLSQRSPDRIATPATCRSEESNLRSSRAALSVLDVRRLLSGSDPWVSDVVTGCGAMSTALSPAGDRMYVVADGSSLLVFDTRPGAAGGPPRHIATVPVGIAPRDLALVDEGRTVVVAHDGAHHLTVIDASRVEMGAAAVRGIVPTRSNVTSLAVTADGRTLFAPNRTARTLQVIDLARLSLEPAPAPSSSR